MNNKLQQEELSKAFLHAITAQTGWKVAEWSQDTDLVDATIKKSVLVDQLDYECNIDIQLKCTTNPPTDNDEFVSWALKSAHAKKVRRRYGDARFLLVLMVVPTNQDDWVKHSKIAPSDKHQTTKISFSAYVKSLSDGADHILENDTVHFSKFGDIFDGSFLERIEASITPTNLEAHYINLAAKAKEFTQGKGETQ